MILFLTNILEISWDLLILKHKQIINGKSIMGEQESQLATCMIMLMVHGFLLLFDPLWDTVARLEWCGLKLLYELQQMEPPLINGF